MPTQKPQPNSKIEAPAPAGAFSGTVQPWRVLRTLAARPGLWLALAALALLGYGYAMTTPAVDMDDLAIATYQQGGEFLRQGRFTVWLLQAATGIMRYQRFWPELFFAVSLLLAGLVLAAVLYTAAQTPPQTAGALLLAGGLLLWPYHGEILMYANQCGVGFGYLLCALALALCMRWVLVGGRRFLPYLGGTVLLAFALGLYESFAPVWLTLLFAVLLLDARAAAPHTRATKQILPPVGRGVLALVLALLWRGALAAALRAALGVTGGNDTAGKTIFWFTRGSLKEALVIPLREFLGNYGALAFAVPALALLALACLAFLAWLCAHRFGNGKTLLGAGLLLSQFALGLLQGTGSQMARASQCFAVFVPFAAWLWLAPALARASRTKRALAVLLAVALLGVECLSLNDTLALNRARWRYEEDVLQSVAAELQTIDPDGTLPVAFTGEVALPDDLTARITVPASNPAYKAAWVIHALLGGPMGTLAWCENPQTLVINWAQTAFGGHDQMYLLMEQIGRPCAAATPDQQAAADALAQTLESGVTRQDGYLLVKF